MKYYITTFLLLLIGLINLTQANELKNIIDIHGHVACINRSQEECYINPNLINNFRFPFYLRALGISRQDVTNGTADEKSVKHLVQLIRDSKRINKIVVLAMDGAITNEGKLDHQKTEIFISNNYIKEITDQNPSLLFGASINPYRKDALERLDEAYRNGAVLIKWLPNIMHIDPSDKRIIPFYERLKKYNLPLLTHTGFEHSFSSSDDRYGDPELLELPLSIGVRVIAAHFGTGGKTDGKENFERILPLFKKYSNLYGDLSGLSALSKLGYLAKVLEHKYLEDRILYGSDYPLNTFPVSIPAAQFPHISPSQIAALYRIKNKFDRDVALKEMFGVPATAMNQSAAFLGIEE